MITFHHPEFEEAVREELNIMDGPITEQDLLKVNSLECFNFDFETEDLETLKCCRNLRRLDFNNYTGVLDFFDSFPLLEELYIETRGQQNCVDFQVFSKLHCLKKLWISGGPASDMDLTHLNALCLLKDLRLLHLHEFGKVDLLFLERMPWLEDFACRYGNEVKDAASIGALMNLSSLCLDGIEVDDLDFLDSLPDSMFLQMCGVEVHEGINPDKLRRFREVDVAEMTVGRKPVYIGV